MNIAFNFDYQHHNGLMSRLLNAIKKRAATTVYLQQDHNRYTLEASGDQETLEALAKLVSAMVPLSIFLKEPLLKEIESIEAKDQFLEESSRYYEIPYCPTCQEGVIDQTLTQFDQCEVCGCSDPKVSYSELTELFGSDDFYKNIDKKAQELIDQGVITLRTSNGERTLSINEKVQTSSYGILSCNIEALPDAFVLTQSELQTLTLVEKPVVRLKPKLKLRSSHELDHLRYKLFIADDLITLALTQALKKRGVDLLFSSHPPVLRCVTALEHPYIVATGRDLLPLTFKESLAVQAQCEAYGFYARGDKEELKIDHAQAQREPFNAITYVPYGEGQQQKGTLFFEPAHAAFASVVLENGLFEQSLCGIHLSCDTPSQLFSYSPKIGYTTMVQFQRHNKQPHTILQSISDLEESAQRLIVNYKTQHPSLYQAIQKLHFKNLEGAETFTELFGLAAAILGFYDGDDIEEAAEVLEANAIEFGGKSGPRIDYKVKKVDGNYCLDTLTTLRSAMSFKLAGVDDVLLSFGFLDSLADFIALQTQNADANIGISGVTLSGTLFENRQLLMRTLNSVTPNYPIYTNRQLGMDKENIVLGALLLGNKAEV
ncbi:MAG: hypothetical protein WBF77_04345 [Sulfurimonadaceae bacterium]